MSPRKGPPLGIDLAKLEAANPAIADAARRIEEVKQRILSGRTSAAHPLPCTDESCEWHHG